MANISIKLSTGSAASTVGTGGSNSLGGKMALSGSSPGQYQITTSDTTQNNLWDDLTKTDNFYQTEDYRCIYFHVISGSIADPKIFIANSPRAKFSFKIANQKNTVAPVINNESTEPVDVNASANWSSENPIQANALNLLPSGQSLNAGDYIYVWIKRKGSAISGSGVVLDNMSIALTGLE